MKISDFIKGIEEHLELETELTLETDLKQLPEWDSLNAMVLISYVSESVDFNLTGDDISSINTVQSLIDKIGVDKFA